MSWDDYDDRYFSDPSRRPRTGLVILVSIVVSAATAAALFFVVGRQSAGSGRVPALVGIELPRARQLAKAAGFTLIVTGKTTDALVEAGSVSTQVPLAGAELPAGAKIGVTISRGSGGAAPPRKPPPRDSGPSSVKTTTTRIGAGTAAAPGTSQAPEKKPPSKGALVTVPRVTGVRLAAARWSLKRAGLTVGRVRYRSDEDHISAMVLSQRPAAGKRIAKGGAVDLVVNNTD